MTTKTGSSVFVGTETIVDVCIPDQKLVTVRVGLGVSTTTLAHWSWSPVMAVVVDTTLPVHC